MMRWWSGVVPLVVAVACVDGAELEPDGGAAAGSGSDRAEEPADGEAEAPGEGWAVVEEAEEDPLPDDPGWRAWTPCLDLDRTREDDLHAICGEYLGGRAVPRRDGTVAEVFTDPDCDAFAEALPRPGASEPAMLPADLRRGGLRVWCAYPGYDW